MKKALVLLAGGTEEMEAVIVTDMLRRAGWSVTVAAVGPSRVVTASRGVILTADCLFSEVDPDDADILILPGGAEGTEALRREAALLDAIRRRHAGDGWIAAICAAPLVLQEAGILEGRRFTCHPAVKSRFLQGSPEDQWVVTDGKVITSQGPGTSFHFALEIISCLAGSEQAGQVRQGLTGPAGADTGAG